MKVQKVQAELAMAGLTGLAGGVAAYGAIDLGISWTARGPQPGYFPFYLGLLLLAASLWNLVRAFLSRREDDEPFLESEQTRRVLSFLAPMAAYTFVSIWLGLYVGSALYLFWIALRRGEYRPHVALGLGLALSIFLYVVFEIAFEVPLHKGPLEAILGLY